MKKRIVVIAAIVLLLAVLFVPIPRGTYRDGGTKDYAALTYRIVVWNRLTDEIPTDDADGPGVYHRTSVYWFPDNFRSVDGLWALETGRGA